MEKENDRKISMWMSDFGPKMTKKSSLRANRKGYKREQMRENEGRLSDEHSN